MVLDHVPGGADTVVVTGPAADAHVFGHGDLYMRYVVGVPDRLEHHVGEAEGEQVLHGLLAQVMVDPEYGIGLEHLGDHPVEFPGRGQVAAEGFLYDDPAPGSLLGVGEAGFGQLAGHDGEGLGWYRHVEGVVAACAAHPVEFGNRGREVPEGLRIVEGPLDEPHALAQVPPCGLIEGGPAVGSYVLLGEGGKGLIVPVASTESNQPETGGQEAPVGQVVDGR